MNPQRNDSIPKFENHVIQTDKCFNENIVCGNCFYFVVHKWSIFEVIPHGTCREWGDTVQIKNWCTDFAAEKEN